MTAANNTPGTDTITFDPSLAGQTILLSQVGLASAQVGAFSLAANSKDAAILVTLEPGAYTAQVSGVGATTGTALVEIYEVL